MLKRSLIACSLVVAIWSIWRAGCSPEAPSPFHAGRRNVVLFLATAAHGLSNVHLATILTLAEKHPSVQVHYASFAGRKPEVERLSAMAAANYPAARPIVWHELPPPDYIQTAERAYGTPKGLVAPPGLGGIDKLATDVQVLMDPWTIEEHWTLYQNMSRKIIEVDPAAVVLDNLFRPAVEATQDSNYAHMVISPNSLIDVLVSKMPWGAMFWKYPPIGSGHPYPVPWRLIPANVYLQRTILADRGIRLPNDLMAIMRPGVPWLSTSFAEASLPIAMVPEGAPGRARCRNGRILCKMKRLGDFDDSFPEPVRKHVDSGRVRVQPWIKADPTALFATGNVKLSVHHGGAGCYHEAVLHGVPDVILPMCFDHYNYAATAEYLGIGVWPTKDTAPEWDPETLGQALVDALSGTSGEAMRDKAARLGETARQYEGRYMAAREVAAMAAKGQDKLDEE
ncbi:hypothetical protein FZEAL_912 [Fusarium zealandicum]|uniref:Erythromycin biosynthesis protein CIII-like C-terminal domain-containing protein n=1 Tax=Fusarium zealandicum TaxID=1053134 RepID=A0A8H4UU55_9HYPO|nr:hypothetical protein FZEAL_912 [Fusarium zealandicum]